MVDITFDSVIKRISEEGIANISEFEGCSEEEISMLENKYNVLIPDEYKKFLKLMGKNSGNLFITSDEYDVNFDEVMKLTEYEREYDNSQLSLPKDALIILGRYWQQYFLIRCNEKEPEVWYYSQNYEAKPVFKKAFDSIAHWLNWACDEALGL